MRREHLGANGSRNEPVSGDGDVAHHLRSERLLLLPSAEVHGTGKRGHHDELGERDASFDGHVDRGVEGRGLVSRQAKDEGPQHVHTMFLKGLELTASASPE